MMKRIFFLLVTLLYAHLNSAQTRPSVFETAGNALNSAISSASDFLDSSGVRAKPWKVNVAEMKNYILASDTTKFNDLLITFGNKKGLFTRKLYFTAIAANRIDSGQGLTADNRSNEAFSSSRGDGMIVPLDKVRKQRLTLLDRVSDEVNAEGFYLNNREVLTLLDDYQKNNQEYIIINPIVDENKSGSIMNVVFQPAQPAMTTALPVSSFSSSSSGCPPFRCDF